VGLDVVESKGESRPGTAGLPTTRITCEYLAPERPQSSVAFHDPVALERNGWREVSAASRCGPLQGSSVPQESASELLASYPEDLLSSPLDVTSARFDVRSGAPCTETVSATGANEDQIAPRGVDRLTRGFTDFLARPDLSVAFALLSLGAAVLFGVLHALAPGHGKTVMAAYLVGQRGTRRQALQLGAVVTFTHTASVLALGAVLAAGALAAPELVVPVTEVLSGVLLGVVGVYLGVLALRRLRSADHGHDHPHHHDHGAHDHGHHHDHEQVPAPPEVVPAGDGGLAVATRPLVHSHGGRTHTHAPLPDGPLSWKALAGMGVAGGLVPSPSALLVLLSANALGRPLFGVLLVVAYGVGMAVTLTAAGLLLLRARAVLDRRGWTGGRAAALVRLLPLGTAGIVVLVGIGLVVRGLTTGRGLL
jgi:nickel/cobalt exporter